MACRADTDSYSTRLVLMQPIVTPEEMRAIDAEAPESVDVLIDRAGWATAQVAARLLGERDGVYGSRVAVLAGKGNNGADGRSAAKYLRRRGVQCTVFDVPTPPKQAVVTGRGFDLVIDACFGTGLRGEFWASDLPIDVGVTPVLAVDIPSGIDGLTGEIQGRPLSAEVTVTFAAPKPGLLVGPGRTFVGAIEVADIGLDCSRAALHLLESDDLSLWPQRSSNAHKWQHAVAVVGGSRGMSGAAVLASEAAFRAGAGYLVKARPVSAVDQVDVEQGPTEAVVVSLIDDYNSSLGLISRCAAVVVGPGLASASDTDVEAGEIVLEVLANIDVSAVIDAGALQLELVQRVVGRSDEEEPLHVLTPHDGEFARITGRAPGPDRVAATIRAAADLDAVVVLKGPTTTIAHPDGRSLISTIGDQRLATAGTGDVLAGIIGAGLALGLDPFLAAGLGVELHGRACRLGLARGLVAGDLPKLVAATLSRPRWKSRRTNLK